MDNTVPAVELLYTHLHALPDDDFGAINLLPFAEDSDQTRAIKRKTCQAIIRLLNNSGFITTSVDAPTPVERHDTKIRCQACAGQLADVYTAPDGVAPVVARMFIQGIAALNPECPHQPLTLDDMRLKMEREYAESQTE